MSLSSQTNLKSDDTVGLGWWRTRQVKTHRQMDKTGEPANAHLAAGTRNPLALAARGSGGPAISWVVSRLASVEVTHLFTILPNLVSATR